MSKNWMCAFTVLGFICGALGVQGVLLGVIAVATGDANFMQSMMPASMCTGWECVPNYATFLTCVSKNDGTGITSIIHLLFQTGATGVFFFVAAMVRVKQNESSREFE